MRLSDALFEAQQCSIDEHKTTVVIKDGEGADDYYWYEVDDIDVTEIRPSSVVNYFNTHGIAFNYE